MTTAVPIHPGEHLAEILEELGISRYRLAKAIGVPPIRINDIVHCRRSITADTAPAYRQGVGDDPRVLAEPPAYVRPGLGSRLCRHRRNRTPGGGFRLNDKSAVRFHLSGFQVTLCLCQHPNEMTL